MHVKTSINHLKRVVGIQLQAKNVSLPSKAGPGPPCLNLPGPRAMGLKRRCSRVCFISELEAPRLGAPRPQVWPEDQWIGYMEYSVHWPGQQVLDTRMLLRV